MAPLRLHARWDGARVSAVRIENRRPHAARLLVGRTVAEATALVPRLFALCGRAQGVAAQLACAAAGGHAKDGAGFERAIAAEAAAEHLWRLLLDWPALLGLAPQRRRFAELHRRLAQPDEAIGAELDELIGGELVPGFGSAWNRDWTLAALAARAFAGGVVGAALARLLRPAPATAAQRQAIVVLPDVPAGAWLDAWPAGGDGGVGTDDFCAAPSWHGAAAETGAFARHATAPTVHLLWEGGHFAAARLWARLLALAACARRLRASPAEQDRQPLADAVSAAPGVGLARVECARGILLHRVRIADGRIADYAICAPTEWNFHPAGPFVREATVVADGDRAGAALRLSILALALDPCVAYVVEMEDDMESAGAGDDDA